MIDRLFTSQESFHSYIEGYIKIVKMCLILVQSQSIFILHNYMLCTGSSVAFGCVLDVLTLLLPFYRYKCRRCVNKIEVKPPPQDSDCSSDLSLWHHSSDKKGLNDLVLKGSWNSAISFVFHHKSHEEQVQTV